VLQYAAIAANSSACLTYANHLLHVCLTAQQV